jgi:hypothetical protein
MKHETYAMVLERIRAGNDPVSIAGDASVSKDVILQIESQELIRNTTKKYHTIRLHADRYLRSWRSGNPLLKLAREESFSPVQMAFLVLDMKGITKRTFKHYLTCPQDIPDMRLHDEMIDVIENDPTYSLDSIEEKTKLAKIAEQEIEVWLRRQGIEFMTEVECRKLHKKTPDFLLSKPINFKGHEIHWIDAKASFGDMQQIERDCRDQFSHYIHLFGPGMVLYWYGFVESLHKKDLLILSKSDIL